MIWGAKTEKEEPTRAIWIHGGEKITITVVSKKQLVVYDIIENLFHITGGKNE